MWHSSHRISHGNLILRVGEVYIPVEVAAGILSEEMLDAVLVDGTREEKSLTILPTQHLQLLVLLLSLNPLRNHFHAEVARERRDGPHNGVVVLGRQTRHERPIDLQIVERETMQVAERRIASAEVVDTQLHTERAQLLEH